MACFYYTKTKCRKPDMKLAPLQGINRKNRCLKRITWHFENWCSCLLNKYTIYTSARLLPAPHESVCTFFNSDVSHLSIILDCFCPFSVWTDFIFDPVTACWNMTDITPSFYHLSDGLILPWVWHVTIYLWIITFCLWLHSTQLSKDFFVDLSWDLLPLFEHCSYSLILIAIF